MNRLLDVEEAAAMLNVSVSALQKWRRVPGKGPAFVKMHSTVRYRVEDLNAFIEERLTAVTPGIRAA